MSDQEDELFSKVGAEDKASSRLIDPTPQRKKYVIDLLYKFMTDQISYSQLAGVSQKELYTLSEVGHIKLKHGRVDEAKKIFECLVRIDSKNPFYYACLGSVFHKMGNFVDAVYQFSEALKLKKDDCSSLVNRGEIYLVHKNYKKAAEDFRAAILIDPEGKNRHANRARSLVIAIKRNIQAQKEQAAKKTVRQVAPAAGEGRALPLPKMPPRGGPGR